MRQKVFLITVLTILTLLLTLNVFAAENSTVTLINKGESIELSDPIVFKDETYYISVEDLQAVNLSYIIHTGEKSCYIFRLYGDYRRSELKYCLSDIMCVDEVYYLPLNELANAYSDIYEIDEKKHSIRLWINDYTIDTYNVTVTVPDSLAIPERGLELTLYQGTSHGTSVAIGSTCDSEYVGYEGTKTDIPLASDITKLSGITIKDKVIIPFTDTKRTAELKFDIVMRNKFYGHTGLGSGQDLNSGNSGSAGIFTIKHIGYYIDNGEYIGGNRVSINEHKTDIELIVDEIYQLKHIRGNVIIPVQDIDIPFTIYAEGNPIRQYNDNGSYTTIREKVFKTTGVINAGETTAAYDLSVMPCLNYDVHIVFDDGNFMRRKISFSHLENDVNYDFKDFDEANILTGTISLPDDMDGFLDFYDNKLSEICGKVVLQQAKAPYYYIDTVDICINTEEKTADFTFIDDIGFEEAVIYYILYEDIQGITREANYKNNSETTAHIKNAGIITQANNNIIINIQKANTITCELTFPNDEPKLDLTAMAYANIQPTDDYVQIRAQRINDDCGDEYTASTYKFSIPDEYSYYSVRFEECSLGLKYFVKNGICTTDVNDFDIFNADTTLFQSFIYNGYKGDFPLILNEVEICDGYANIIFSNPSKTDYEDVQCYLASYDDAGKLLDVFSDTYDILSHNIVCSEVYISKAIVSQAAYYQCFLWDANLKPLSEKIKK